MAKFSPAHGITLFVSDGGVSGVYSAVIVKSKFGGIYGERVFQAPPNFEKTFVTPQCDFSGGLPLKTAGGGLPLKTAGACLSGTAVVAGDSHRTPPPDQHAQEHVQLKEWFGSSHGNLPMAVTKVFLKGYPKHFVLKTSCRGNLSTTVASSRRSA